MLGLLEQGEYEQPVLHAEALRWNSERNTLIVRSRKIHLTPTEYRLLYSLRQWIPLSYTQLAVLVYNVADNYDEMRAMIDKHIDRIRGKLRGSGLSVYCIRTYGYMLLPAPPPSDPNSIPHVDLP
jgi:DNA-binding response OmpR family regulator